jgi:trehalose 6-phosphate phosphatase
MKHQPYFERGAALLDELAAEGDLLCAFDFDGTLAPIVAQPEQARMPLPVLQRLRELIRLSPVAVITGRSLADIGTRLECTPHYVIGNHGAEGVPGLEGQGRRHAELCRGWKNALEQMMAAEPEAAHDPGIRIEDKVYSLSIHYRLARDREAARERVQDWLSMLEPPARLVGGKCVHNILPQEALDKGRALVALMQASGARHALFIGDDVTDEHVFQLHRPDILGVRIGRSNDSAAPFYLNHRLELIQLLDRLLHGLRGRR